MSDELDIESWAWKMCDQWHPNHTIFRQMCRVSGITYEQYANLVASGVARTDAEVKAADEACR